MFTVEGLSPDTMYVLQLRAHTRVGEGPPNNVTVITCKLLNICRRSLSTFLWQVNNLIFTQEAECIRASDWQMRFDDPEKN